MWSILWIILCGISRIFPEISLFKVRKLKSRKRSWYMKMWRTKQNKSVPVKTQKKHIWMCHITLIILYKVGCTPLISPVIIVIKLKVTTKKLIFENFKTKITKMQLPRKHKEAKSNVTYTVNYFIWNCQDFLKNLHC